MNEIPEWERVYRLFADSVELEPDAREVLLERLARTEPELVAEVRSLLSAHLDAGGFLEGPAIDDVVPTLAPGDRVGPYRIIEETGRGGMGVVFRAVRDDGDFTKEVAVKLIYPRLMSEENLRRFRAERQILALLDHPHIARLLDGGKTADGSPFLVMDFVAGKPLTDYCDAKRLSIDERLAIFLEVCDAVQFAHQRLVIHRDLKPDNILVNDDGSPRLLDFGIAKLLRSAEGASPVTVTAPMSRVLTLEYASPEQIRGEPVTVATDVYSLGVILYELLSGSRPHRFATRSPEEVLRVMTEEDPVPPSTAALAHAEPRDNAGRRADTTERLRRRLSGDLDFVVLKALEKDVARRYGSVEKLALDLRRHVEGLPVLARGHSTAYLVSRFVRRHRRAVLSASMVVLALVAGLAGTTWQARRASRVRE
jgi:eukaryotic-like serine/threonine-protein kinase